MTLKDILEAYDEYKINYYIDNNVSENNTTYENLKMEGVEKYENNYKRYKSI